MGESAATAAQTAGAGTHPALERASALLGGVAQLPVDERAAHLEQVHGELQSALADAEGQQARSAAPSRSGN